MDPVSILIVVAAMGAAWWFSGRPGSVTAPSSPGPEPYSQPTVSISQASTGRDTSGRASPFAALDLLPRPTSPYSSPAGQGPYVVPHGSNQDDLQAALGYAQGAVAVGQALASFGDKYGGRLLSLLPGDDVAQRVAAGAPVSPIAQVALDQAWAQAAAAQGQSLATWGYGDAGALDNPIGSQEEPDYQALAAFDRAWDGGRDAQSFDPFDYEF